MATRFEVRRCTIDDSRELLVLGGIVTEGMVGPGMQAAPEGDPVPHFPARVHSVEFLEHVEGDPDSTGPALTFHFRNLRKLQALEELPWSNAQLVLSY